MVAAKIVATLRVGFRGSLYSSLHPGHATLLNLAYKSKKQLHTGCPGQVITRLVCGCQIVLVLPVRFR